MPVNRKMTVKKRGVTTFTPWRRPTEAMINILFEIEGAGWETITGYAYDPAKMPIRKYWVLPNTLFKLEVGSNPTSDYRMDQAGLRKFVAALETENMPTPEETARLAYADGYGWGSNIQTIMVWLVPALRSTLPKKHPLHCADDETNKGPSIQIIVHNDTRADVGVLEISQAQIIAQHIREHVKF